MQRNSSLWNVRLNLTICATGIGAVFYYVNFISFLGGTPPPLLKKNYETYYRSARVRILTSLNNFEWFCTISNHFPVISKSIVIYLGFTPSISFYIGIYSSILLYLGFSSSILFFIWLSQAISVHLCLSLAISCFLCQSPTISGNFSQSDNLGQTWEISGNIWLSQAI